MNEIKHDRDDYYFMLTGPMGGYQDPRFPEPKKKWDTPWTAECSKSSVRRFLDEAKYYLNIYNVVVQHFVSILPFEKYVEENFWNKRKRDRLHSVLWNAGQLEKLLNSRPAEAAAAAAALLEDDAHQEVIDREVEKSFQSLRELMCKSVLHFSFVV